MTDLFTPPIGNMVKLSPKFVIVSLRPKRISEVLICCKLIAPPTGAQAYVPLMDYTVHFCSRTLY